MSWIERMRQIPFSVSDIEVSSYNKNVTEIGFSIYKILESYLIFIRVNIDHKENETIIEKGKAIDDISVIKDVLSQRKT